MAAGKEKSSYSFGEKLATVRVVKASSDWKQIQEGKRRRLSPSTMSLARAASGGATDEAIRNWLKLNIDEDPEAAEEEEKERLAKRGAKQKFDADFKALLVGFAIHRRLSFRAVSAQDLIDFAHGTFGRVILQQRVSEILNGYGFTSQLSMGRNSRMTDEQVVEDCVSFILELRNIRKSFWSLLVMDETGLWSNVVARLTYHFRNLYEIMTFALSLPNSPKLLNCVDQAFPLFLNHRVSLFRLSFQNLIFPSLATIQSY